MSILAWLWKVGHEHCSPAVRAIDIDRLVASAIAGLGRRGARRAAQPQALLSATVVRERRGATRRA